VDVDSLDLYLSLYGWTDRENRAHHVRRTYELGVRRFVELLGKLGIPAVFFVVGRDLLVDEAVRCLSEARAAGHSLGNHTYNHRYDLIRLPEAAMREEIAACHMALRRLQGSPPTVFRAPGYNVTSREYGVLEELGYRYDASPLPSYPYLLLKYTVMASLRLKRRRSHSIWGNPRAFLGSRSPYRRGGLTVLPNAATSWLRLPVIGTALSCSPRRLFSHLLREMRRLPFVSLEFHAIDLMELGDEGLASCLAAQKDLAVPLARKLARYEEFLATLLETHEPWQPH